MPVDSPLGPPSPGGHHRRKPQAGGRVGQQLGHGTQRRLVNQAHPEHRRGHRLHRQPWPVHPGRGVIQQRGPGLRAVDPDSPGRQGAGQAPDPAGVRAVDEDTIVSLSDYLVDDDLIRNGEWDRASQHDEKELGPGEHWDYDAIEDAWIAECRYSLAARGITWDRDAGTVTVPADMTDETAAAAWQQVLDGFPAWISGVIDEARKGRFYVFSDDLRSSMAPGARWVTARSGA
jgi:hypothetical protein